MVEDPANLVLEHLRAIRSDMHEMKDLQREQGHRLSRIELSVAGLRREQAGDAENVAHLEARFDQLREDIERIKKRLEIVD
jgi:septal ring factor EnvC (AmiA/AmiB activator)